LYQSPETWLETVHPDDRKQIAHAALTKQSSGEYHEKFCIVRPDGALRWIRDRAFPIRDSSGKVIRIVGIAEDVTEQHQLERQLLEISDAERTRIGQDLHDSLCQKLISIAFDNNLVEKELAGKKLSEAKTVQRIGEILDDAITEARAISRGLFPVQLEADGLKVALEQLAASAGSRLKINCRSDCPQPVLVNDNIVATHLYRIAQEAVTNAVKHGKASSIVIQLRAIENRIELKIADNGIGIPASRATNGGMGLHIMNYRARTIGGSLQIERAPDGGTVVFCSARQNPI
jgi:two-component system sensor kinase FixL